MATDVRIIRRLSHTFAVETVAADAIVKFQTFAPQNAAIQLVSVKRTGTDDITVTWQILTKNKSKSQVPEL